MKHDCTECPIRKLMEKHFPPERTRNYDITKTDHACGYLEFFEFDDTPGWRSKDYWINDKNCMLNKATDADEETSDKVKYVAYKILKYYDYDFDAGVFPLESSDEIGEEDINSHLENIQKSDFYYFVDESNVYLNRVEVKSLYKFMGKFVDVVPGYVLEEDPDPDNMLNDPRWDD